MIKTVDARGLVPPQPVLLTRQALADHRVTEVVTIVDEAAEASGLTRLGESMRYGTSVEEKQGSFYIHIDKKESSSTLSLDESIHGSTVLVISSNTLGNGEEQLGASLMRSFIYSLTQMEGVIRSIIFINSGVFLTTEGSAVLDYLTGMEERGVEILSSATCLDYYHLQDRIRVGATSNIFAITEKIIEAPHLVTF